MTCPEYYLRKPDLALGMCLLDTETCRRDIGLRCAYLENMLYTEDEAESIEDDTLDVVYESLKEATKAVNVKL